MNSIINAQVGDPTDISDAFHLKKKNKSKSRGMLVVVSAHIIPNPNIDDQEVKVRESDLTHMDEVIFIENISQTSEESNISELEEFVLQVS